MWNRSRDHISHVTFTCKWHTVAGQHGEQNMCVTLFVYNYIFVLFIGCRCCVLLSMIIVSKSCVSNYCA